MSSLTVDMGVLLRQTGAAYPGPTLCVEAPALDAPRPSSTIRRVGTALLIASAVGCAASPPPELPLRAQIAEVDRGTRETIHIETVALGDVDLDSLAYVTGLQTLLFDNPNSQFSATGLASLHRL